MEIVFIGGIHGSGKSQFCAELAPAIRASHYVASDLLRLTSRKDKAVADVRGNQDAILRAIGGLQKEVRRLLLDGHFCLLTTAGDVQEVPVEYFATLAPKALILLEAPVSEIQQRLVQRDETPYPTELLKVLLECERLHATRVRQFLGVPIKVLTAKNSLTEAVAFLAPLLS